jgi:hypothetical protein
VCRRKHKRYRCFVQVGGIANRTWEKYSVMEKVEEGQQEKKHLAQPLEMAFLAL